MDRNQIRLLVDQLKESGADQFLIQNPVAQVALGGRIGGIGTGTRRRRGRRKGTGTGHRRGTGTGHRRGTGTSTSRRHCRCRRWFWWLR